MIFNPLTLRKLSKVFPFNQKNTLYFGHGRTALEKGYRLLGLKAGDEVLYPDYICDVTLVPSHRLGLCVRFYCVDDALNVDLDSVSKALSPRTRAILVVNYFGFPQNSIIEIKRFCNEMGLYLIEDNAHGFLSKGEHGYLGSWGDISIFSFRKTFPIINGAALLINNMDVLARRPDNLLSDLKDQKVLYPQLKVFLKKFLESLDFLPDKNTYSIPPPGITEHEEMPFRISPVSRLLLRGYNAEKEIIRRRRAYQKWDDFLSNRGITPVFRSLPEGTSPLAYPGYTSEREKWIRWGRENNIHVHTWPTLPKWVWQNVPSAVDRWERMVVFPLISPATYGIFAKVTLIPSI